MTIVNPTECIRQSKSVLRQRARSSATLAYPDEVVVTAKAANIEVEEPNLRYAEIRVAYGYRLVIAVPREVHAQFVHHCWADRSRPAERGGIVARLEGQVVDRPLSAIEIIEPDDIRTCEELVLSTRIVHTSVVFVATACVGYSKNKKS